MSVTRKKDLSPLPCLEGAQTPGETAVRGGSHADDTPLDNGVFQNCLNWDYQGLND
jgi:hypothetical protein